MYRSHLIPEADLINEGSVPKMEVEKIKLYEVKANG